MKRIVSILLCAALIPGQQAAAAILNEVTKTLDGYKFYFQDYNWNGEDNMLFRITRGKRVLEERRGHKFWIVSPDQPNEEFNMKSGRIATKDLTGNGIPDVVVQEWTGGVHGNYNYYVYESVDLSGSVTDRSRDLKLIRPGTCSILQSTA